MTSEEQERAIKQCLDMGLRVLPGTIRELLGSVSSLRARIAELQKENGNYCGCTSDKYSQCFMHLKQEADAISLRTMLRRCVEKLKVDAAYWRAIERHSHAESNAALAAEIEEMLK